MSDALALLRVMMTRRVATLHTAGLVVLSQVLVLALPLFLSELVTVGLAGNMGELALWTAAASVLFLTRAGFVFARSRSAMVLAERIAMDLRMRLLDHSTRVPLMRLEAESGGDIASKIFSDTEVIKRFCYTGVWDALSNLLQVIVVLAAIGWMMPQMDLVVITVVPLLFWCGFFLSTRLKNIYSEIAHNRGSQLQRVLETLKGMRTVRAQGGESLQMERFDREQTHGLMLLRRSTLFEFGYAALAELVTGFFLLLVLVWGAWAVRTDRVVAGDLIVAYALTGMLVMPLARLGAVPSEWQQAKAAWRRISQFWETGDRARSPKALSILGGHGGNLKGRVTFDHVFLSVEGESILEDVHFEVEAGDSVAVIGSSGSGKSLLTALLAGLIEPTSGRVLVDGMEVADLPAHWRRQLLLVPQQDFLFYGSVRENINYFANANTASSDWIQIARLTGISRMVQDWPHGLETQIGNDGTRLSGGERQRISIARALCRDPRLMILDEATSALDAQSEESILSLVAERMAGRTWLVTTHRPCALRHVKTIIVLEGKKIAAIGALDELRDIIPNHPLVSALETPAA